MKTSTVRKRNVGDVVVTDEGPLEDLKAIRMAGYTVAVHNDYKLDHQPHTFWLFTHSNGTWIKGEGKTDAQALQIARASIPEKIWSSNEIKLSARIVQLEMALHRIEREAPQSFGGSSEIEQTDECRWCGRGESNDHEANCPVTIALEAIELNRYEGDLTFKLCVIGRYCERHDFIHGAEAEELREKLEKLSDEFHIQGLLESVDARDSTAWSEFEGKRVKPRTR